MTVCEDKKDKDLWTAPCLAFFWSAWCGPCYSMESELCRLEKETPGAKIYKINMDENPELTADFGVIAVPSLFFIVNGKIAEQRTGIQDEAVLNRLVKASSA